MSIARRASVVLVAFVWVLLVLAGAPRLARADAPGDAWAAAKRVLGGKPRVLVGIDANAIESTSTYKQVVPTLLTVSGGRQVLDETKKSCGVDVLDVIEGIVAATDDGGDGVIFVSLKNTTPVKLAQCLAQSSGKNVKVAVGAPDAKGIVEVAFGKDKIFVATLPKNVAVIATETSDKAMLEKWIGGKGIDPAGDVGKVIGNVNTAAPMWCVVAKTSQIEAGMTMKVVYGSIDLVAGNVNVDLRMVLGSAAEATNAAAKANQMLAQALKSGQVPREVAVIAKTVKISSSGIEARVTASVAEKDLLPVLGTMLGS